MVTHACEGQYAEDETPLEIGICVEGLLDPFCVSSLGSCVWGGTPLAFATSTTGQGVLSLGGVHQGQEGNAQNNL